MLYSYSRTYRDIVKSIPVLDSAYHSDGEKLYSDLLKAFRYVSSKVALPAVVVGCLLNGTIDLLKDTVILKGGDTELKFKEVVDVLSESKVEVLDAPAESSLLYYSFAPLQVSGAVMQRENVISGDNACVNIIGHVYPKFFNTDLYEPEYGEGINILPVFDTFLFPTVSKYFSLQYEEQGDFVTASSYEDICLKYIMLINEFDDSFNVSKFSGIGKVTPYAL